MKKDKPKVLELIQSDAKTKNLVDISELLKAEKLNETKDLDVEAKTKKKFLNSDRYLDFEIEFEIKNLFELIKYNKLDSFKKRLDRCLNKYDSNVFVLLNYLYESYVKN